ncbi:NAD(P)-binding protein [Ramaria rubella]|nr:NAD(P)-binding protein [Ramaria rubella]
MWLHAFGSLIHVCQILNPPGVVKEPNPLRFGILGAASIAIPALILAARSHAEAVVAVAARDEQRAIAFAKKNGIDKVYHGSTGYQGHCRPQAPYVTHYDPNIDVIYNPLPHGLHFEWTAKALKAGKHVLLEKPSTTSSEETLKLFELATSKGVVLLEAFHYQFHPATRRFLDIIESGELGKVKSMKSEFSLPRGIFIGNNNNRLKFDLGGGSLLDPGCYPVSAMRTVVSAEPTSVLTATHISHLDPKVDRSVRAVYTFPNDVTAEMLCDLQEPWYLGFIPRLYKIYVTVQLEGGEVTYDNFAGPHLYNSITVTPKSGKKRVERVYKPREGKGEEWWTSYRYQLEALVDKVKGRATPIWVSQEESVNQMKALEMVYEKIGLLPRYRSSYVP